MNSATNIADALGRKQIADALGLGKPAVSNAVAAGVFPAAWFRKVSQLCAASGVDCPMDAFSWRGGDPQTTPTPPTSVTNNTLKDANV